MRRQVPFIIATVAGVLMLVQFFVPAHGMVRMQTVFTLYTRIIGGFAMVLGVASLMQVSWVRVKRRADNWPFALTTILGFVVMFSVGVLGGFFIHDPTTGKLTWSAGIAPDKNPVFGWLFYNVYTTMDATIFSLLAFYMASAAYRAMRARDLTAGMLLGAAIIVMLGRAPLTAYFWDMWLVKPTDHQIASLGEITEWLLTYPNTAATRALMFGTGLAALAQGVRILVGLERPYMAGTGD